MPELRIVAGRWRGRRIQVPPSGVRPTADRVREAWMSILQPHIPDARVLDLCAGSGALGLECLSRGATHCDFVEKSPAVAKVLTASELVPASGSVRAMQKVIEPSMSLGSSSRFMSSLPMRASAMPPKMELTINTWLSVAPPTAFESILNDAVDILEAK